MRLSWELARREMRAGSGVRLCGDGIYHRAKVRVKPRGLARARSPAALARPSPGPAQGSGCGDPTYARRPARAPRAAAYRTSTWKGMIASGSPTGRRATVDQARSIGGSASHASASSSRST